MEYVAFFILGTIDIFLVLAFIFKIFRWPLGSYIKECILIAFLCSLESFANRFVFDLAEYDALIQVVTIMLCVHYILRVNFYHAITLSVIGVMAYFEVVYVMYQVLEQIDIVSTSDAAASVGEGTFIIQLTSETFAAIIVWLIYKFNLGFSYVAVPPHDRKTKFTAEEKINMTVDFVAALVIFATNYCIITLGRLGIGAMMVSEFIALCLLLYLARRRDYAHDRPH
ncbi:hypothetical protein [Paenibacillus thalictri]|uniref:Uncharacterized protein n=1 Tax=Paenibacillus thalictri TaxID=2527873 RepID=A0A4Q9DRS7_9BACL|nr:hypothetical protein [Paenibacillus thalictri]TBL78585.1 hypothetical protein EYB31_13875 [Paenibacillus thalictri]